MKFPESLSRLFIRPSVASLSITLVVALGAFVAKTVGLGKELVVAYRLGAGPELDAFLYAYAFPAFVVAVVGGGVAASFIPRYLATEADASPEEARRLAGELASIVAAVTCALSLLAIPTIEILIPMLAGGFDAGTKSLAVKLIPILSPLLVVSVFTSMWSSLLNAHRRFAAAAFIPAITPFVVLTALYGHASQSGAMSLAIGTLAGGVVEVCVLAACTRAAGLELFCVPRRWRVEYGLMLRQFIPAAASIVLMSATMIIDQSFAANLSAGSLSALSYGTKLAGVIASILVVIVSTLALPMFSRLSADESFLQLRRAFFTAAALSIVLTLPIAAMLALGAEPILRLLFERGSFSSEDVRLAASVQSVQAWHIAPYILSIVAVRALAAISETWIMLVGSIANLLTDVLVNTFLVPVMGVVAVGLATTAMYSASALVLSTGFLLRVRARISEAP